MKHFGRRMTMLAILMLFMAACGAPPSASQPSAAQPDAAKPETKSDAGTGEAQDFITWYQYDQANEDPKSDERVGNEYLRKTIPQFNQAFAGKWNWVNQPKAFDKMVTELIAAAQAGGDVPDLIHVGSGDIVTFHQNGTLQEIGTWAEAQPWFKELDPNAVEACRGPDGKLYCVPVAQLTQVVFVWKDRFPNGYPTTPDAFLKEAEALKANGLYAITFFGSTDFDGEAMNRFMWTALSSFGGKLDDGQGKMALNTPENVAAISFLREIVAKGYAPEIVFAGKFQEEEAFKDASAGSFPTGIFGYRYVNPLTAPSGTKYEKKNEADMLDAIAAGDVYLAPSFAAEGHKPGCNISASALAIPTGAKHPEAAQEYINWLMSQAQNAAWVIGPGGGFPVLKTTQSDPLFQTPFYEQGAKVTEASACRPWYGSLTRRQEAQKLVVTTIYKLIKEDPTADIAAALTAASDEYNAGG